MRKYILRQKLKDIKYKTNFDIIKDYGKQQKLFNKYRYLLFRRGGSKSASI